MQVVCWHDGRDYDEKVCVQRRRSAKIFARRQRPLPFPQCLKCKPGMAEEISEHRIKFCEVCGKQIKRSAYKYCDEHRDYLPKRKQGKRRRLKRLDEFCISCGALMPEDAPKNRVYCDACKVKRKKSNNRAWFKAFYEKHKQSARCAE